MLKSITMSKEQTETYNRGDERAEQLMRDLRQQAKAKIDGDDRVEIYTADGIVADSVTDED